jgi:pimeloyl-ACP methyl ester carboxylesterase
LRGSAPPASLHRVVVPIGPSMRRAGVPTAKSSAARVTPAHTTAARLLLAWWILLATLAITAAGCASTKWVSLRSSPRNPLTDALGLVTRTGPKPTSRTVQLLRRYDLEKKQSDKAALLAELSEINRAEPNRENIYALAELAYVGGKRADAAMRQDDALELYGDAVVYAYQYLFDHGYPTASNSYDPQFRFACDLYNGALESMLRIVQKQGSLKPGTVCSIKTANGACELEIKLHSRGWHAEDFDHVEFVSDYEVHGLRNHYHNFGLGVPLIAVRKHHEDSDPREQYYPPDLSFPLTAFLRLEPEADRAEARAGASGVQPVSHFAVETDQPGATAPAAEAPAMHAVLELYDPLDGTKVDGVDAPLETDLSTPLAHFLSQPALDENRVSTLGLLHPEAAEALSGLYMLEPFDPEKIPVVMVHGLWSSPVTWMELFNDLRSDPTIRKNYQFWFYMYPSGQPFWYSAAKMRSDLAHMRGSLDPQRRAPALDQTVLVGHSMGGLVSKLQTVDSGNKFWQTLSDKPFAELDADPEVRDNLAETFFFEPNPSIRRVITIGTPHRGSDASNNLTKWLGRKLIDVPSRIMQGRNQLFARNPDYFLPATPLNITNSIDSLSPKSPILPVLLEAPAGPWVKYHNIVGQAPREGFTSAAAMWLAGEGDGVVSLTSARLDGVASQVVVPSDHQMVHRHPASIREVRRILREHVSELESFPYGGVEYASQQAAAAGQGDAPVPQLPGPVAMLPTVETVR